MPTTVVVPLKGKGRSPPLSLFPTLLILLPILSLLTYTSVKLHYALPSPETQEYAYSNLTGDLEPIFSERRAMGYIRDLSTYGGGTEVPRYRIVGTKEMQRTDEYLLAKLEEIKREVIERHPNGGMQVEVWHQIGDGSHLFDFMDKMVWKKYFGISNIIVRLSDGTQATKANSILVNAHTDSTLPSPGAADDLVGVAAMLESLRVMALGKRRLTNSVVFRKFLAKENLFFSELTDRVRRRQCSMVPRRVFKMLHIVRFETSSLFARSPDIHKFRLVFITQHPLKDTVRAVINLEACGTDGKEITFQATSEVRSLSSSIFLREHLIGFC